METKTKLTPEQIEAELCNFYGTQNYYQCVWFTKRIVMTDGVKFVADQCEAHWLVDVIASHIPAMKGDWFAVAKLKVKNNRATFKLEDGDGNVLRTQKIEFTDFPLESIEFFIEYGNNLWVILLPNEH